MYVTCYAQLLPAAAPEVLRCRDGAAGIRGEQVGRRAKGGGPRAAGGPSGPAGARAGGGAGAACPCARGGVSWGRGTPLGHSNLGAVWDWDKRASEHISVRNCRGNALMLAHGYYPVHGRAAGVLPRPGHRHEHVGAAAVGT